MTDASFRLILRFHEIRCAGCLNTIEGALRRRGAESVRIDLASHIAEIIYRGDASDADRYCAVIRAAGYRATLIGVLPQTPGSDEPDASGTIIGSSSEHRSDLGV